MASSTDQILKQFADQAVACEKLGSPFTAQICRLLADNLNRTTRFGWRILEWPGDPYADNIALRAAGALHALARTGWEPTLTQCYPPNSPSGRALWFAIADAMGRHSNFLADRLDSPPQTNEVARSGLILGGMLAIADVVARPLEIYEIGASAGLNLAFDRYAYRLGGDRVWGSSEAPLTIDCEWRGGDMPLKAPLEIAARHGCDLNPIDPASPGDRERLLSYVWADQAHRIARVDAALRFAAAEQRQVQRADAADWLEAQLAMEQPHGVGRVLYHTIVWQYLPPGTKARIEALLARLSTAATLDRPLARLSIEADGTPGSARIDVTIWPTGRTVTLGRGDFHGRWAEWN